MNPQERGAHTPGPWFFGRMLSPANAPAIIGDGDTVVAILPGEWNGCTLVEANARLIAAAPDLLEACQQARSMTPDGGHTASVLDAAIAKATGTQP